MDDTHVLDLTPAGIGDLSFGAGSAGSARSLERQSTGERFRGCRYAGVKFCAPVERQEVWAAGVTYLRSKTARMEESDFSATAYDRVYDAERPEIFFKAVAEKVVAADEPVGIRPMRAGTYRSPSSRSC